MVKEWVRGDHLALDRNPNYWENGQPLPYLDGLEFRQVPEDSTKVLQVQAGSLNGSEGLPWSQLSDSRGNVMLFPQQQIYLPLREPGERGPCSLERLHPSKFSRRRHHFSR
jgi:peptide/nickel transport system substrate-binding protein